jgi:hypothetical protein
LGATGGISWPSTMAISSVSITAPHPTSSIYCGFSTNLLRIRIAQYVTVNQKSTKHLYFLFHLVFTLTKNTTRPAIFKLCTHKHLNTARGWVLMLVLLYITVLLYAIIFSGLWGTRFNSMVYCTAFRNRV